MIGREFRGLLATWEESEKQKPIVYESISIKTGRLLSPRGGVLDTELAFGNVLDGGENIGKVVERGERDMLGFAIRYEVWESAEIRR